MIKMDMIWISSAVLIYPKISHNYLVSQNTIEAKIRQMFNVGITPIMILKHLVSWEDRQADKSNPSRGGSRNRYLFRTEDGTKPSSKGEFRLYKQIDSQYDGWEKIGRICPEHDKIPENFRYLIEWYKEQYYPSE